MFIFDFLAFEDPFSMDSYPSLQKTSVSPSNSGSNKKKSNSKKFGGSAGRTDTRKSTSSLRYHMGRVLTELFSDPLILKLGWSFFSEDGKMIRAAADGNNNWMIAYSTAL